MSPGLCRGAMGRFILSALILCVLSSTAQLSVFAWGEEGHKIVAKVAEHYLTDTARQRILQLLKDDQKKDFYTKECPQAQTVAYYMACVSTWADRVRNDRPETANWHFVDIPNHFNGSTSVTYDPARDCQSTRDGDCVIRAIEQFRAMLAKPESKSDRDHQRRIEAVKFLIHFIGDMHQPLHASDENDRGGNGLKVFWLGKEFGSAERKYEWNLHSVWDSAIVEHTNPNVDESVARLLTALGPTDVKLIQKGSVVDWANEAHVLAVTSAYNEKFLSKKIKGENGSLKVDLSEDYYAVQKPIVDQQLERAGVRLAGVLNELFGA